MVDDMETQTVYEIILTVWIVGGLILYASWRLRKDTGPIVGEAPQRTFPGAMLWPLFLLLMIANAILVGLGWVAKFFKRNK